MYYKSCYLSKRYSLAGVNDIMLYLVRLSPLLYLCYIFLLQLQTEEDHKAPAVTNLVYELPLTHHQRSLTQHMESCTTPTVVPIPIIHCTAKTDN